MHELSDEISSFGVEIAVERGAPSSEGSPFAGQTVAWCDLRRLRNVSILAVREPDGGFTPNPDAASSTPARR